jgi:hypothetical protein
MVDFSDLDKYYNGENAHDGDIMVFVDGGVIEQKVGREGDSYNVVNFNVEVGGKKLIYTPDARAIVELKKMFGRDTEAMVGQKVGIKTYPKKIFGKDAIGILPLNLNVKA